MTELTLDSRVVANTDVLSTDIGDQIILMDVSVGKYFVFEATARDIWQAIAAEQRIGDVCDRLGGRYDAPGERVKSSSLAFLQTLLDRGLIRVAA